MSGFMPVPLPNLNKGATKTECSGYILFAIQARKAKEERKSKMQIPSSVMANRALSARGLGSGWRLDWGLTFIISAGGVWKELRMNQRFW